jgi:hypothetical protein
MPEPGKLPDQMRDAKRIKHYPYRTGQTYIDWIKRFIFLNWFYGYFRFTSRTAILVEWLKGAGSVIGVPACVLS